MDGDGDEMCEEESEEAGGNVVEHDAGAFVEAFELADGWRLEDVEETEEEEAEGEVFTVGRDGDEGDELAGDLVDDDVAGVFAVRLARDDGGGGDADERDGERGDDGGDGQREMRWIKDVCGNVPEQNRGDATVGARTGLEQASSEEGADGPGPEGFFLGELIEGALIGHEGSCRSPAGWI